MSLCVYSRGMVIWQNICWGYALVFFSRDILGLNIWGSAHVCFFVIYYLFIHFFFFLLYSMVTKLRIHVRTGFHHIVVWQCKYLDRILNATQQDLIVHPFQDQQFAPVNPKLPIPPTPSLSPWAATSPFSKSIIFSSVEMFICAVYQILVISDVLWSLFFSF